ncbi:SDR family oxidoreductase [Flexithrix dorotheae]|uniref:SDR family oxidoreductase n=1 Tax=Flexithrix dorotheae TaxID=70993 RepID=UPI00035FAA05|nr:SDR family oxidoreductase [Flexithrix dorotheae]
MKILFIGGTGNISASCTRLAIAKGHEVYLLIRGSGNREIPEGAKVIKGDIKDIPGTKAAIKDHHFDAVANFIAFTPEDIENDIEIFNGKTDQYIFISSASCYQKPLSHPIVTESTPLKNPFWQYSRDKISCEDLLNKVYREDDFPMTIVRPSLTYGTVIPVAIGSWEDYTIIDRMKKGKKVIVHGDGTSLWTITHADDFAIGFTGLLGHQQAIGQAFHITSDEILTWNQIYEAVAAAAGVKPNFVHIPSTFIAKFDEFQVGNLIGDKAVSVVFDNTKIKTFVPEFNATITFKKGIKRTVDWFEAKAERMKIVEENNVLMDKIIAAYEAL